MERKILWLISFAVIFILWLKVGPLQNPADLASTKTETPVISTEVVKSLQPAKKTKDNQVALNNNEAKDVPDDTLLEEEEASYFNAHPIVNAAPDFAAIADVKQRKEAFFSYLSPFIEEKNSLLLKDRDHLQQILDNKEPPSREDKRWLKALREIFKLPKTDVYTHGVISELFLYVDIIPQSLVLAQAANESAWGTSRFATEGNNYFGQWCFRKGCGLVPEARDDDADHEVRRFKDARKSVFAYIDNLNINPAYRSLRESRAELRQQNKEITGLVLAKGLLHYSQKGQDYVDEIQSLIDYNKLWRFNRFQVAKIESK